MSEKLTYKELLTRLPDEDIFMIEKEVKGRDNRIAELIKTNDALKVVILEYYSNISVLNSNSERILLTLNPTREPKQL